MDVEVYQCRAVEISKAERQDKSDSSSQGRLMAFGAGAAETGLQIAET
jgi:hypothetical protein